MIEGELRKKLCLNDISKRGFNTVEQANKRINQVLDEAAADFPKQKPIYDVIDDEDDLDNFDFLKEDITAWYEKWFGKYKTQIDWTGYI